MLKGLNKLEKINTEAIETCTEFWNSHRDVTNYAKECDELMNQENRENCSAQFCGEFVVQH